MMKTKKVKLFVFGLVGCLMLTSGFWFYLKKFKDSSRPNKSGNLVSVISDDVDSDNDGLLDKEERDLGTNIYQADSDSDGYNDGEEVRLGFDPLKVQTDKNIDIDNDGLTGEDEAKYKTDPHVADSDFDGYLDGEEIVSGNDPLQADLSKFVSAQAVYNATKDNNQGAGSQSEDSDDDANVVEITEQDRQQVNYLEKAFSAQDVGSFQDNMMDYIQAESEVEKVAGDLQLPEVTDSDIKIINRNDQEVLQKYVNEIGEVMYKSFNRQNLYNPYQSISGIENPGNDVVNYFSTAMTGGSQQIAEIEVPNDPTLIDIHKKLLVAFTKSNDLWQQVKEYSSQGDQESTVKVMNNFSELTFIMQTKVVGEYLPELESFVQAQNLQLPEYTL